MDDWAGMACDLASANLNCYQLQTLDTCRHNDGFAAHTKLAAYFNQYKLRCDSADPGCFRLASLICKFVSLQDVHRV